LDERKILQNIYITDKESIKMQRSDKSLKQLVVDKTKETGVIPCIKLKQKDDFLAYAQAMYDGGARIVEITSTTPGVIEAIEAISNHFKDKLFVAAGTVLDPTTAREVILHGGSLIVNPCVVPEVADLAHRYQIPIYTGAFTATEVFNAMKIGSTMVKIAPGSLGGPKYMTYLKMLFPHVDLVPSGGINPENVAEFIKCGACAVSGARTFMNRDMIDKEGIGWINKQVAEFIKIIKKAKETLPELP
jgi:2-dehydro-3-deoxyphosphogluconate aldolase/(4S)-4-hydroxy-2-oxoglutarate aldolase